MHFDHHDHRDDEATRGEGEAECESITRAQLSDTQLWEVDRLFNTRSCPPGPEKTFEDIQRAICDGRIVQAVQPGSRIQEKHVRYPKMKDVPYLELLLRLHVKDEANEDVLIGPGQFPVDVWKNKEMMRAVFLQSLKDAGAIAKNAQTSGYPCVTSINAGDAALHWDELVPRTLDILEEQSLPPELLGIEICENVTDWGLGHALKASLPFLIKDQRVNVIVDDYPKKNSKNILEQLVKKKIPVLALKLADLLPGLHQHQERDAAIFDAQRLAVDAGAQYLILEGGHGLYMADTTIARDMYTARGEIQWLVQSPPGRKSKKP